MTDRTTYRGSCHCGAVRFAFVSAAITTACRCNCSICKRRGARMSDSYVPPADFIELTGLNALTRYRFGDELVNHYFCAVCGIYPFHDAIANPGHYRVNLGCIDDLDPASLDLRLIDGRSF